MAIPLEMKQLIGIPYDINSSPRIDLPLNIETLDCRRLVHEIYSRRYQIHLPVGMWSQELFSDSQLFQNLNPEEKPYEGDIYFFGSSQPNQSSKQFHLAVFTGEKKDHQPLFIHASAYNGKTVTVENYSTITNRFQHSHLKGIKRLQPDLFNFNVLPVVYNSAK